jgi:LacI family transcriptional regulator
VDTGAKTLVQGALSAGIPIPDQLLIVGVGNDEIECELADISLSSVALAEERIGYEAASLLHNMLQGQPAPDKPVHITPSGVVVRDSSDTVVFSDPQLSAAVRYIHEHVADSIKVTDVLPVVSLSRRELERRFAAQLGHSPHAEIRYSQLNRAKELLAQSDLPMSQVALAAGFKESKRLSVVFRQETGMSPSEYRWEFRCASEAPEGSF